MDRKRWVQEMIKRALEIDRRVQIKTVLRMQQVYH